MTQREFPSSAERSCFFLCTGLTAEWRRNCCFGSRAGSWGHSPLECCLRYSLNSHTGRWIALPHFFFFTSVPDCSGDPPPPNIPRWEKMERSDMLPCAEARKSHFDAHYFFVFFFTIHSSSRLSCIPHNVVLQLLQIRNHQSHRSLQLKERVGVIYFWRLA